MIIRVLREKHQNHVLNHAKLDRSDYLLLISSGLPCILEMIQLLYCACIYWVNRFFLLDFLWISLKNILRVI